MSTFKLIEIAETKQRLHSETSLLVDTRDTQSFNAGHIEGAFNLTNDTLQDFFDKAEFETSIFVVCYHGNSSKGVAEYLVGQGYQNSYSVEGGMALWGSLYPVDIKKGSV